MRKRRMLAFGLVAALAGGLSLGIGRVPAQLAQPGITPAPGKGKRAQEFIAAFNKGDAKAVAGFWTADGDYVDQLGSVIKGRAAIEKLYEKLFAAQKGAKLTIMVGSVRQVTPDVALEDGITEV